MPARSKPPGRGHPLRASALKTVATLRRSQPKHAAPRDTGADLALIALVPYAVAGYRNGVVELTTAHFPKTDHHDTSDEPQGRSVSQTQRQPHADPKLTIRPFTASGGGVQAPGWTPPPGPGRHSV